MSRTTSRLGGGVTLERGVDCRMSDGILLRSDHYYAAGDVAPDPSHAPALRPRHRIDGGLCPSHLVRAPRIQRGDSGRPWPWRARRATFYPFRHEGKDGAETIAWLRSRPECNGRIGMYGFSYQGATQLLAAAEQPKGLECIAPAMTACDLYRGWFYHNGALRLASSLGWGLQMLKEDARRLGLHEASAKLEAAWSNVRAQASHLPYAEHPSDHRPRASFLRARLVPARWTGRLLVFHGPNENRGENPGAGAPCLRLV